MTSGVAEMLLQSNMGYINLLPALPDAWSDGSVEGLVARGNFELSYDWTDGKLNQAQSFPTRRRMSGTVLRYRKRNRYRF